MFYGGFCEVCEKKMKKNEQKTQTLAARISNMVGAIFFKFGMWTPLPSRTCVAHLVSIGKGITELQKCGNCIFFLLIYSRCGAPAPSATRHTTMCLDKQNMIF